MTPFARARAAFAREVAARYHKKVSALRVAPEGEDFTGFAEHKTGKLYAFEAEWPIVPRPRAGAREVTVRGFASADGEVVLEKKNNLGVLMREAHLLDPQCALDPRTLAQRILWLLPVGLGQPDSPVGPQPPNHELIEHGPRYIADPRTGERKPIVPPFIERRPDGSASLIFFYRSLDSVEMGMRSNNRAEVRVGPDYKTTLHRMRLLCDEGL